MRRPQTARELCGRVRKTRWLATTLRACLDRAAGRCTARWCSTVRTAAASRTWRAAWRPCGNGIFRRSRVAVLTAGRICARLSPRAIADDRLDAWRRQMSRSRFARHRRPWSVERQARCANKNCGNCSTSWPTETRWSLITAATLPAHSRVSAAVAAQPTVGGAGRAVGAAGRTTRRFILERVSPSPAALALTRALAAQLADGLSLSVPALIAASGAWTARRGRSGQAIESMQTFASS